MKTSKIKTLLLVILTLFLTITLATTVNADMGVKPSITIKIENMPTKNYLIDLLVYDESGDKYSSPLDYNGNEEQYSETYNDLKKVTVEQLKTLYEINYDGWISESTRWNSYLLFADCSGNDFYEHTFSYFGTPERYKVLIINNDTGEIKVSDEIIRDDITSSITIDYKSMNTTVKGSTNVDIVKIIIALLVTIIIEFAIALIMKLSNNKMLIIVVNIITNLVLQAVLIFVPFKNYLLKFIIMEIVITITEYLIYKKNIKNQSTKKILIYTLIANLVTAALTFFI